ncbi:MAG: sigma 54-interacting transcriptional regulator, partial [Thermodesulfobacteriota bacterium]
MQQRAAEDLSKRIKNFKILSSITQAVHQSLDLEEIYKITLDMTADLENVDLVMIYLVDEDRKEAVLQAQRNLPEDYLRRASRIPYPKGATWEVVKSGKVLNIEDIQKDPDVGPAGKALGHHGVLGIPIVLEEKVIGVIWFSSYKERKFHDGEVELLSSIGNQIAIAIAKANLYRVLHRKNLYEKIISTVTQSVHQSIDLKEVMDNAVEAMNQNIEQANIVEIYLIEDKKAVLKSHIGYKKTYIKKAGSIPYPKGFIWETAIDEKPIYCPDTEKDTLIGPAGRAAGIKAYLSMPIRFEGKVTGVIGINSFQKHAFDEEEIKLLQIVANQIETAINNASQAEALKQSEEALKRSEEHFRLLVETTNVIPWEADAKTFQFTYVGPQAQGLLGYPAEQWYEQDFWQSHIHPDDSEKAIEKCLKSTAKKKDFEFEYRMISSDGNIVWFHDLASVITEDGEPKTLRGFMIDITERRNAELELKNAFSEIEKLKNQLERENIYLQEEVKLQHSHGEIVGESKAIQSILSLAEQVANTESTVLLLGETGTGKELLANAIHNMSPRKERAIVMVNCAALQPYLIESELFGHERGAFTGAVTKRVGRFEIADGSTVFLDEVADLSLELQGKLLRVLQENCFERLGSGKTIEVDVRILAATNRDLSKAVEEGTFREDLFYRLNVFPINLPPLREREEDIPLLVNVFVKVFGERMGKNIENIPKKTMEALMSYKWPGNIRELRNVIERAII